MPDPASTAAPAVRPSRLGRFGRALLAFSLFAWTALVGVSAYQWIRYAQEGDRPPAVRVGLSLFFLAGPLWVLARRLRGLRRPLPPSLTASAVLTASVAVFLAWLAHDDEEWRHSERHPALRNDFPEAAATGALTLRYSQNAPGSLLYTLPDSKLTFPPMEAGADNDTKRAAFLAKNGPALDKLWRDTSPLRAWIDELAAAPALGDLAEKPESPILGFRAARLVGQLACAHALQLAADGRRDEAVETLLPVLVAAQKLEPHSRTLVRRMISIVLRRQTQNALSLVLDGGDLSPAIRARLAAALAPRSDVAEQARLLICSEYEIMGRMFISLRPADADAFSQNMPSSVRSLVRCVDEGDRLAL